VRIPEINGLRGFAILAVIFHHLYACDPSSPLAHLLGLFPGTPLTKGYLAVNLFFVLSGFVLFYPYAEGAKSFQHKGDWNTYYLRRARRLMPLFGLCVFILWMFVRRPFGQHLLKEMGLMLTGAFHFTPSWFLPPGNGALWSLGVEIWFSVLFPIVVLAFVRFGTLRALLTCFSLAMAVRLVGSYVTIEGWNNAGLNPIKDNVFGRLDDFAVGMAVAHVHSLKLPVTLPMALLRQVGGMALVWGAMILLDLYNAGSLPRWTLAVSHLPINLGCGLLLMGLVSQVKWSPLNPVFCFGPLQLVGMMCYSLYIWHETAIPHILGDQRGLGSLAVYATVLFGTALLTYRYVEFGDCRDWRKLLPGKA